MVDEAGMYSLRIHKLKEVVERARLLFLQYDFRLWLGQSLALPRALPAFLSVRELDGVLTRAASLQLVQTRIAIAIAIAIHVRVARARLHRSDVQCLKFGPQVVQIAQDNRRIAVVVPASNNTYHNHTRVMPVLRVGRR